LGAGNLIQKSREGREGGDGGKKLISMALELIIRSSHSKTFAPFARNPSFTKA
jgi:hypothetical protein